MELYVIPPFAQSVTMSNWTPSEVNILKEENCGGNAVVRASWHAKVSSSQVPSPSTPLADKKAFIREVYIDQLYFSSYSGKKKDKKEKKRRKKEKKQKKKDKKAAKKREESSDDDSSSSDSGDERADSNVAGQPATASGGTPGAANNFDMEDWFGGVSYAFAGSAI
jgi:hypothetical protein